MIKKCHKIAVLQAYKNHFDELNMLHICALKEYLHLCSVTTNSH